MDNNKLYQDAVKAIGTSVQYMIEQSVQSTQIYNGVITSMFSGAYSITLNGKSYNIPHYGSFTHSVGDVVKVFVPQGNMNMAFFI